VRKPATSLVLSLVSQAHPALSRNSSGSQDAGAASLVVSSALADTPALGAVEDERECRVGIGPMGPPVIAIVARLLCWVRHRDWAHSTGYGANS
jgi:hypothetical protein